MSSVNSLKPAVETWPRATGPALLVSVRSAEEARAALAGGADVIDVKEPARGSLGAADPASLLEVSACIGNQRPLSVACGELLSARGFLEQMGQPFANDACPTRTNQWLTPNCLAQAKVQFAKFGLAGAAQEGGWQQKLLAAWNALPLGVAKVAVIYADWRVALSPSPEEIIEFAAQHQATGVLWDTFLKPGGLPAPGRISAEDLALPPKSLLECVPLDELAKQMERAREGKLFRALAGSLRLTDFPQLMPLAPDYLAVRGAACSTGRHGQVQEALVKQLKGALGGSDQALNAAASVI